MPASTTVGFTGHESEDEFGLVNMKGRIFDPKLGRFLTTDPLVSHPRFSQSWNPYSYVLNNPLSVTDPTGFDAFSEYHAEILGNGEIACPQDTINAIAPTHEPGPAAPVDAPHVDPDPVNHGGDKDSGAPPEHEVNGGSPAGDVQAPTVRAPDAQQRTILAITPQSLPDNIGVATLFIGPIAVAGALLETGAAKIPHGLIKAAAEARQTVKTLHKYMPPPGSNRKEGHALSKHGLQLYDPRVLDIRNSPDKIYVGTNSNGHAVSIFFKGENVVITDLVDTQAVITAYGEFARDNASPEWDKWAENVLFYLVE
jgi:RHS repeat-associated protein